MVKIDREKCIGCGACVAICSDCFEMDDEYKAILKKDCKCDATCKEAIESC